MKTEDSRTTGSGWAGKKRTIRKNDSQLEETGRPLCVLFAGYAAFPCLEVERTRGVLDGFGVEAEGMVFAPLLPIGAKAVSVARTNRRLAVPRTYLSSCNLFMQSAFDMVAMCSAVSSVGTVGDVE